LLVSIAGHYRAILISEFEQGIGHMPGTNLNRAEEPATADDLDRETRLRSCGSTRRAVLYYKSFGQLSRRL
jgi:hypothetical protein